MQASIHRRRSRAACEIVSSAQHVVPAHESHIIVCGMWLCRSLQAPPPLSSSSSSPSSVRHAADACRRRITSPPQPVRRASVAGAADRSASFRLVRQFRHVRVGSHVRPEHVSAHGPVARHSRRNGQLVQRGDNRRQQLQHACRVGMGVPTCNLMAHQTRLLFLFSPPLLLSV